MHRVLGHASTGSKASGLWDNTPEAGEYLSNKYEIRISPNISVFPSGASLKNLWTNNNFATEYPSTSSVVNIRPTTVACWSHSVSSSFMHNTMMNRCDATCSAVRWCQSRLVWLTVAKEWTIFLQPCMFQCITDKTRSVSCILSVSVDILSTNCKLLHRIQLHFSTFQVRHMTINQW